MLFLTKKNKQRIQEQIKIQLENFFKEQWEKIQKELEKDDSSWTIDYEADVTIDWNKV